MLKNLNQLQQSITSNKDLIISILIATIYFLVSLAIRNDINWLVIALSLSFVIFVVRYYWDQSNHILSALFLFILLMTIFVFALCSIKTKQQQELQLIYNLYQFRRDHDQLSVPDPSKIDYYDIINEEFNRTEINQSNFESYNIFFIETNNDRQFFSSKQLCSIESAARNNPKANVYVFSIRSSPIVSNLLSEYSNLHWLQFSPLDLFIETPLWNWWMSGDVFKSSNLYAHVSDAARLALLWKYGGVYSDLDTISIRSFRNFLNYSGPGYLYEKGEKSIGNGFLHFRAGHPFLKYLMTEFSDRYNPNTWGGNGPTLLTEAMASFCNVTDVIGSLELTNIQKQNKTDQFPYKPNKSNVCDLIVFPNSFFYPYNYEKNDVQVLFYSNKNLNLSVLQNTYSVHFYGAITNKLKVNINDNSLYEYLAFSHCNNVYNYVSYSSTSFN